MISRLYCTVNELLDDLGAEGVRVSPERVLDKIRAASRWIDRNIGPFIPIVETRYFDGDGTSELYIDTLVALTSLTVDGMSVEFGDCLLYPRNRLWDLGPHIRIVIASDSASVYQFTIGQSNVAVEGRWGLWEQIQDCGVVVASQSDTADDLVVNSAAGISVGAVLLIDDEQEVVIAIGAATDSMANLATALDTESEILTLDDVSLVEIGEVIKIQFEQLKIVDSYDNQVLVVRGWNSTKRTTHASGADVLVYRTFTVERGANGTSVAAHTATQIVRYVAPEDIRWLCKQMAGLMLKKADSGFSGRAGSPETGETFYINEFPKSVIDQIKGNYYLPYL